MACLKEIVMIDTANPDDTPIVVELVACPAPVPLPPCLLPERRAR
jgi:hypothetical protein